MWFTLNFKLKFVKFVKEVTSLMYDRRCHLDPHLRRYPHPSRGTSSEQPISGHVWGIDVDSLACSFEVAEWSLCKDILDCKR